MFDIGFSELVLIALLALIVLGPKRLPEAARTAGRWMAKLRHFVSEVRHDLDRELRNAEIMELQKLKHELDDTRRIMAETSSSVMQKIGGESMGDSVTPTAATNVVVTRRPARPAKKTAGKKKSPRIKRAHGRAGTSKRT